MVAAVPDRIHIWHRFRRLYADHEAATSGWIYYINFKQFGNEELEEMKSLLQQVSEADRIFQVAMAYYCSRRLPEFR
jgi:hypothetical protein